MYRVIGREIIGKGRKGKYLVEYDVPWENNVERMYLIAEFTGWFPGHIQLRKQGRRGKVVVKLWPGIYPYGYATSRDHTPKPDPENPEKIRVSPFYDWKGSRILSLSRIPYPTDPLDNVVHNENDPAFINRFMDTIVIRLRAPSSLDEPPLLEYNKKRYHPYIWFKIDDKTIVYEYHVIETSTRTAFYRFHLQYKGEKLVYGDEGISETASYIVADLDKIAGPTDPKWYMGTIYYQIFIDSFYNGEPSIDPPNKITRIAPRERGYYGGDLIGVIKKLDHLVSLGIEALYLTPIFPSPTYHRYDVIDYFKIDKYLGTMNDLINLVEKLHKNNIKLVLDIPMHHTSPCNPVFIDALEKLENSRYYDWFQFLENIDHNIREQLLSYVKDNCNVWSFEEYTRHRRIKPFYEGFFMLWGMPRFNHENTETLNYFINITKYWMQKGVDGFRIDVALGIHYQWLKAYYSEVKNMNRDFLILGELNDYPPPYMEYFDSTMDYYWRKILLQAIIDGKLSAEELLIKLNKEYVELPHYQAVSLYHALGTHDTPRIKTLAKQLDKLKLLYALLFILPGSPAIYYGDEIGLEGGHDPDNRKPMLWDKRFWNKDLLEHIKKLIKIYKEYKCVRHGFYKAQTLGNILVVKRELDTCIVYLLANISNEPVLLQIKDLKLDLNSIEFIDRNNVELDKEGNMKIHPYGYVIISQLFQNQK